MRNVIKDEALKRAKGNRIEKFKKKTISSIKGKGM